MTGKTRVMAKHRGAFSVRNPAGGWDIRTEGNTLLGQGNTAGDAWWDAWCAIRDAGKAPAPSPTSWPFPVSGHNWSTP